ncbi:MAG: Holliday junction resolvase Hjc [Candidatus Woesearchaeota archaeon]
MNAKAKGTAAERELIHFFNNHDWVAFRAAGSGSSKYPCPDLVAGNKLRKLAIEVKVTASTSKYFTKQEINDLKFFAEGFGAEPWTAIKFNRVGWFFVHVEDLRETNQSFTIDVKVAKIRGLSPEEIIRIMKKD